MRLPKLLLGTAMAAMLCGTLAAQQASMGFYTVSCVKARVGKALELRQLIDQVSPKLDQAIVASGRATNIIVLEAEIPEGEAAPCDYEFVTFDKGMPPGPWAKGEFAEVLQKAGIQDSAESLMEKRESVGKLMWTGIWHSDTYVGPGKEMHYLVVNSINPPDFAACEAYENKEWKPLAEEMLKEGTISGWAMDARGLPNGTKDGAPLVTVDLFPSWDAAMNYGSSIGSAWKKLHGDSSAMLAGTQFDKLCPREHTALYRAIYSTTAKK